MDEPMDHKKLLLDDILRDITSQKESLKMISQICNDQKVQRLLHTVVGSQKQTLGKILRQLDEEKEE